MVSYKKILVAAAVAASAFCVFSAPSSAWAADPAPFDEFAGTDKAVYDNAKRDGLSDADASAKAGGYVPPAGSSSSMGSDNLASSGFKFNANDVSPSSFRYDKGSRSNLQWLAERISNVLLIGIATLAALLIAVAGLRMALSAGNTDEASKGKTMLRFNVMALAVALLSYAIVNLLSWIISAN